MNELHSVGIHDKSILNPKNTQTFERGRNQREKHGSMKVEEGGLYCKKYNGYCTK
jgi:hypothetical protein